MSQDKSSPASSNIDLSVDFPLSIPLGGTAPYRDTSEEQHSALKQRFADIYGCAPEQVLLVNGLESALDLLIRTATRDSEGGIFTLQQEHCPMTKAAGKLGLDTHGISMTAGPRNCLMFFPRPGYWTEMSRSKKPFLRFANDNPQAVIVVDESCIEYCEGESLAADIGGCENLVAIRSPDACYGTRELQITALIANEKLITRLSRLQPEATLPPVIINAALEILSPLNMPLHIARVAQVISERDRLAEALPSSPLIQYAVVMSSYYLVIKAEGMAALKDALKLSGISICDITLEIEDCFRITIGTPVENNALLAALGAGAPTEKPTRIGECIRNTNETQISVRVDLDNSAPVTIDSGIAFFDHMLEQIARHGDFSLVLSASGDLEIDAHHTVEDCALALGAALKSALGDRAGIGRYGFSLPMDEASATVMIDLSGRPATRFDAEFPVEQVGELQTQMISHFFESLSVSIGAAIHIEAQGENAHHMIEAIFKSVGRALRPAFARDGDAIPSTKGVL